MENLEYERRMIDVKRLRHRESDFPSAVAPIIMSGTSFGREEAQLSARRYVSVVTTS